MQVRIEGFEKEMPSTTLRRQFWAKAETFDSYMHVASNGASMIEGELGQANDDIVDLFFDLARLSSWEREHGTRKQHRLHIGFPSHWGFTWRAFRFLDFAVRYETGMWGLCFGWKYNGRVPNLEFQLDLTANGFASTLGALATYFEGSRSGFTGPTLVRGQNYAPWLEAYSRKEFAFVDTLEEPSCAQRSEN